MLFFGLQMRIQCDLDGQDEAYYPKYVMPITFTLKKIVHSDNSHRNCQDF